MKRYLTPAETSDEYGIALRLLKTLRTTRRLSFVKVGHRTILFDRRDVEALLESHKVAAVGNGGGRA